MLKFPQEHTGDKKANKIIAEYLNGNILKLVKEVTEGYEKAQGREAGEADPIFWEAASRFFPEGYPEEKMGKVFMGLKALLESEHEFVPELAMEYVMYRLIEERIDRADGEGVQTLEPIPSQREYVIHILKKEYPDADSTLEDSTDADISISWKEKLESLEDLHYYDEIYFWDTDYLFLDEFTETELKGSAVSEFIGIDNIEDESRKFEIPAGWLR